jgi:transposase InsO family protein
MEAHHKQYPIQRLSKALKVSRSGYYDYLKHQPGERELANEQLLEDITTVYEQSGQRYGSPRIQKTLQAQGKAPSLGRVKRLMRKNGIYSIVTPDFHPKLQEDVAPGLEMTNLLKQEPFEITTINQVWYVDITLIKTLEGWLYLAGVIDGFSKRVVGYAMADNMKTDLVIQALRMAVKHRRPPQGLIHHSDKGSQYTSYAYQDELLAWGMKPSFTGTGACLDNAFIESFWATLKKELVYQTTFTTLQEARSAIFEYIEVFYNRYRLHSSLDYTSPATFEARLDVAALGLAV